MFVFRYLNVLRHYLMERLHDREDLDPWLRHLILAQGHYDLAWNARNSEQNPNWVSEAREARFQHHLQMARRHAIGAWHVRPQLPEAPAELIQITMSIGGKSGENPRFWFDQTVKADFIYQEASFRLTANGCSLPATKICHSRLRCSVQRLANSIPV